MQVLHKILFVHFTCIISYKLFLFRKSYTNRIDAYAKSCLENPIEIGLMPNLVKLEQIRFVIICLRDCIFSGHQIVEGLFVVI